MVVQRIDAVSLPEFEMRGGDLTGDARFLGLEWPTNGTDIDWVTELKKGFEDMSSDDFRRMYQQEWVEPATYKMTRRDFEAVKKARMSTYGFRIFYDRHDRPHITFDRNDRTGHLIIFTDETH